MSLHDYLFILGIQRRLTASGSRSLLRHSMTPASLTGIRQAIPGNKPTQAKSLSLGEYVFPTDNTFMHTHTHCQMSVFILFHCNIHVRLFSFSCFLLVCLINLKKTKKISCSFYLVYFPCLQQQYFKKTQKDFPFFFCLLGAFPCKQFSFPFFGGREERTMMKMWKWLLYALLLI